MDLKDLINIFTVSISKLDVDVLSPIDPCVLYNEEDKEQFLEEIEKEITKIRGKGFRKLFFRKSKCAFCFPDSPTYSFYDPETEEFVIRFTFHQEGRNNFTVQECRNRILPLNDEGLPF